MSTKVNAKHGKIAATPPASFSHTRTSRERLKNPPISFYSTMHENENVQ